MGLCSNLSMSARHMGVSWRLPSPVTKMPLLSRPASLAAWNAPADEGPAYPMLPKTVWLYIKQPFGILHALKPNAFHFS